MSMSAGRVVYQRQGPLAELVLDRPTKLNAINAHLVAELHAALDRAEGDDAVRVILLRGEGRAFSAGFDLEDSAPGKDVAALRRELERDFDIIMRFWDSPKPTLAAVHGYCLGSAMEMAVACDVTVASSECRLGAPEVRFGSGIVTLILPWVIGVKQAKELLLTGDDRVTAERALALGLVNRVVPPERLLEEARALAREIAVNDPVAVTLTKQAINKSLEVMGMRPALRQALELDVLVEASETPQSRELNEILERDGMKAALAWRERQLAGAPAEE